MPCFSPDRAWRPKHGTSLVFNPRYAAQADDPILLPCKRCAGCAVEDARQYAVRAMHELSVCGESSFITLTYSDSHLPPRSSLRKADFQDFAKRYRSWLWRDLRRKVRFMYAGEYGDVSWRPHYHAIVFGHDFSDKKLWRQGNGGFAIFRSERLEQLWPFGHCEIGSASFQSASYVARYTVKKYSNRFKKDFYSRVDLETGECFELAPEFVEFPRGKLGGLGMPWLRKFQSDVFPGDRVVVNSVEQVPPKFYLNKLKQSDPFAAEQIVFRRVDKARVYLHDSSGERLRVKEAVLLAKQKFFNVRRDL